jgi:outer membrane lipopolysaccharide assembly protein LptE/RlpB
MRDISVSYLGTRLTVAHSYAGCGEMFLTVMTHTTKISLSIASVALLLSACGPEQRATNMPPGSYEKTTESTDKYGTTVEKTQKTDVTVDEYGNKKAVVKTKTTQDPKGILNKKTTSESTTVIDERR